MYLKPADLRKWLIESQAAGTVTPELYHAVLSIISGIHGRHGVAEREDCTQDVFVLILRNLHRIDPDRNVFSYITTLIRNASHRIHRERVRIDTLAARVWDERPRC